MKRAKQHAVPKPPNPVARSPLLRKGGAHGKSGGALRRKANVEMHKLRHDPNAADE